MLSQAVRRMDGEEIAAIATTLAIYGICIYLLVNYPQVSAPSFWWVSLGFAAYLGFFIVAGRDGDTGGLAELFRLLALAGMLLAAFALLWWLRFDFLSILTIIWAAVLVNFVRFGVALGITTAVVICWFSLAGWLESENLLVQGVLFGTFHLFAMLVAASNQRERQIADALRHKNDELLATQELLAQVSRQSERTRIARELHDLVGHHLTGLTIKLQVASRIADAQAKAQIDDCYSIARVLLNDVRDAVDSLRHSEGLDLEKSVALLSQNVPNLRVHFDMDHKLSIENMQAAQAIFRCIQEAITNSLKHAHASDIWATLNASEESLHLHVFDNGSVREGWREGNGLAGMRERIQSLAGEFNVLVEGGAMHYRISLPRSLQ